MEYLEELTKCKSQIERELRLVGHNRAGPYPKRLRGSTNNSATRDNEFGSKLRRLKFKWGGMMNNVFHAISDWGTYDKLAYDLTKSFGTFYNKYAFDGDQLISAFKCIIIPITGQILDEDELGRKARERQDRRKYFLRKMMNCEFPDLDFVQSRATTPSLDGSIDVCSESPVRESEPIRDNYPSQQTPRLRPSPLTIIILDVLVDALGRHSKQVTKENFMIRERIHHVINILLVVELLRQYFDDIRSQLDNDVIHCSPRESCFESLSKALERYEQQLWEYLNLFTISNPLYLFKDQMDLLLYQIKLLKPILK